MKMTKTTKVRTNYAELAKLMAACQKVTEGMKWSAISRTRKTEYPWLLPLSPKHELVKNCWTKGPSGAFSFFINESEEYLPGLPPKSKSRGKQRDMKVVECDKGLFEVPGSFYPLEFLSNYIEAAKAVARGQLFPFLPPLADFQFEACVVKGGRGSSGKHFLRELDPSLQSFPFSIGIGRRIDLFYAQIVQNNVLTPEYSVIFFQRATLLEDLVPLVAHPGVATVIKFLTLEHYWEEKHFFEAKLQAMFIPPDEIGICDGLSRPWEHWSAFNSRKVENGTLGWSLTIEEVAKS
ncbi:MAG: hypothetical protein WCT39_04445 [Candidatus Margulisiibacteriota bacterium]